MKQVKWDATSRGLSSLYFPIRNSDLKFTSSMLLTVAETKFFDMKLWILVTALNVFVANI